MAASDKPNLILPLASTYNPRGVASFTTTLTNAVDQRKINSMYDLAKNPVTGKLTPYLVKRPGVTLNAASFGTSGQNGTLVALPPGVATDIDTNPWVFSQSGNDVRASSSATTTVIATAAGFWAAFVDHTAISGTDNLVVQLRSSSTVAQRVFYSTAIATFTEISAAAFTGLIHRGKMEHLDGYALILTDLNRIHSSDVNSLSAWGANNYLAKTILQDAAVGLAKLGEQIIAFGQETAEMYVNNGNPGITPLTKISGPQQRIGLITATGTTIARKGHYYATLGGRIYFVGHEAGGSVAAGVWAYDGQKFEKVSTSFIDRILSGIAQGYFAVSLVGFAGKSGIAITIDRLDTATQRWLMFFPEVNEWFEWTSTVFCPVNSGQWFLGAGNNQHRVYSFANTNSWQDDTTEVTLTHQFTLPGADNERKVMTWAGVRSDTAAAASSLGVSFSDDGDDTTYSTARNIDLSLANKRITRCGSYRNRSVRLTHSANLECRLEAFLARIE